MGWLLILYPLPARSDAHPMKSGPWCPLPLTSSITAPESALSTRIVPWNASASEDASFSVAAFYLISASVVGILGSVASFAVAVALTGFEVLIQALQAYIFTLLAAVYISGALHAEH